MDFDKAAAACDEIAEGLIKLGGIFRAAGKAGGNGGGSGKAVGKPAAGKAGGTKPVRPEPDADEEVDEDSLREALSELAKQKGKKVMVSVLAAVGAGKLADVDESQYGELKGKIDELMAATDEEADITADKKPAKKTASKKVTLEQLTEAAHALIKADKAAYLKIVKKMGSKPSESEEGDYATYLKALEGAMPDGDADEEV